MFFFYHNSMYTQYNPPDCKVELGVELSPDIGIRLVQLFLTGQQVIGGLQINF